MMEMRSAAGTTSRSADVETARPTMEACYFGPASRRLFGVFHRPAGTPRATLLMCPPLLHEHFRSYRFFSQVADELAAAGIACFRFDYYGMGDSGGVDADLSPKDARRDILAAAVELRRRTGGGGLPLILMGVRASAMFVWRDAVEVGATSLWLWQPVVDGAAYLRTLEAADRAEYASRARYPLAKHLKTGRPDDLMGYALSPRFRTELAECSLTGTPTVPVALVTTPGSVGDALATATRYDLPPSLEAWTNEIELNGVIQLRDAQSTIEALLRDLPKWTRHG